MPMWSIERLAWRWRNNIMSYVGVSSSINMYLVIGGRRTWRHHSDTNINVINIRREGREYVLKRKRERKKKVTVKINMGNVWMCSEEKKKRERKKRRREKNGEAAEN